MLAQEMYIVEGARTPFCKFHTMLSDEPIDSLGISPAKSIITSSGLDPTFIDQTVFGCCYQPATTIGNIARRIGIRSGADELSTAVTVHRNCASGFEAITYACDKAAAGKGDVFLVGGVESMSQSPFIFSQDAVKKFTSLSRSKSLTSKLNVISKFRPKDFAPQISLKLALTDHICDMNMGQTAELLAREYHITRTEQDEFSERSHQKALHAQTSGIFDKEISPFYLTKDNCIRSPRNKVITSDNSIRSDASTDKLSKLKTVFDKGGTVTAGNSSQITDGGVALILMTPTGLRKTGCTPIAQIIDYAYTGCDPRRMGLGPVSAMAKICHTTGKRLNDADLIEINEAFAAQVLSVLKYSSKIFQEIPLEKLNINGGAIALGHPLAATGARLIVSMVKQLRHRHLKSGLASLCVGGGQGGAIWIETV